MDDDLHVIYLATPLTPFATPWERYFDIHQALPAPLLRIAARVGVDERFLFRARSRPPSMAAISLASAPPAPPCKGNETSVQSEQRKASQAHERAADRQQSLAARAVQIHARFFSAMILRELLLESRVVDVAEKYHVARGVVQQVRVRAR